MDDKLAFLLTDEQLCRMRAETAQLNSYEHLSGMRGYLTRVHTLLTELISQRAVRAAQDALTYARGTTSEVQFDGDKESHDSKIIETLGFAQGNTVSDLCEATQIPAAKPPVKVFPAVRPGSAYVSNVRPYTIDDSHFVLHIPDKNTTNFYGEDRDWARKMCAELNRAVQAYSKTEAPPDVNIFGLEVLRSGSLRVCTKDAAVKNSLLEHRGWVRMLQFPATLAVPLYGVIAHGVNHDSATFEDQEEVIENIRQHNDMAHAQISHIQWLKPPKKHASDPCYVVGSVIIWFNNHMHAEELLGEGQVWICAGMSKCVVYDAQPLLQCERCQEFGHHKGRCMDDPACRHCAEPHYFRNCKSKDSQPVCANCNDSHKANDLSCDHKKRAQFKLREARILRPVWHERMPSDSGGSSEASYGVSSDEASEASEEPSLTQTEAEEVMHAERESDSEWETEPELGQDSPLLRKPALSTNYAVAVQPSAADESEAEVCVVPVRSKLRISNPSTTLAATIETVTAPPPKKTTPSKIPVSRQKMKTLSQQAIR